MVATWLLAWLLASPFTQCTVTESYLTFQHERWKEELQQLNADVFKEGSKYHHAGEVARAYGEVVYMTLRRKEVAAVLEIDHECSLTTMYMIAAMQRNCASLSPCKMFSMYVNPCEDIERSDDKSFWDVLNLTPYPGELLKPIGMAGFAAADVLVLGNHASLESYESTIIEFVSLNLAKRPISMPVFDLFTNTEGNHEHLNSVRQHQHLRDAQDRNSDHLHQSNGRHIRGLVGNSTESPPPVSTPTYRIA
jgi:hypothetical protein